MLDPDSTSPIIVLVSLLILHAFFAAAKEAIISVRRSRRLQLIEEGNPNGRLIDHLATDITHLLATEQLALKLIGFFIIAVASFVYASPLSQALSVSFFAAVAMITIVTALITLVLGELIPREIARGYAETVAFWTIQPVNLFSYLTAPLARIVTKIGGSLTGRPDDGEGPIVGVITEEDLRTYVDAGEEGGALNEEEKEMIYSIFKLDDTLAREIMVPRIDVMAVDAQASVIEGLDIILEAGHSRVPVYVENIDNIIGILYAKDLLAHWRDGGESRTIRGLERSAYFVPETKPVSDLLSEFQSKKVQMAIVVDEYGGTAGLVTIEDILEEIVGEIQDEYDPEQFLMQFVSDDEYIFNARMDLDDINDTMSTNLPTDETDTLGGLVYNMLGRVPEAGDSLEVGDLRLTVLAVDGRRIDTVRVQRITDYVDTKREGKSIAADNSASTFVGNAQNTVS